jgi:hypothetical protein
VVPLVLFIVKESEKLREK